MLEFLLPVSGTPSLPSNLQLRIHAFVTREKEPHTDNAKLLRTVWFKPWPTDAPISAILGPNSWLWLGAIISASFVIFLIIIGVITRYYIYPKDKNTNRNFSYSLGAFFSMAMVCISIAMTASAVVLWNKKRIANEEKQNQNAEGSTPAGSPGSGFYNADMELESLPHQSLVQAINVHYGQRPELKSKLLDFILFYFIFFPSLWCSSVPLLPLDFHHILVFFFYLVLTSTVDDFIFLLHLESRNTARVQRIKRRNSCLRSKEDET